MRLIQVCFLLAVITGGRLLEIPPGGFNNDADWKYFVSCQDGTLPSRLSCRDSFVYTPDEYIEGQAFPSVREVFSPLQEMKNYASLLGGLVVSMGLNFVQHEQG